MPAGIGVIKSSIIGLIRILIEKCLVLGKINDLGKREGDGDGGNITV